jgi:hypothetical protein
MKHLLILLPIAAFFGCARQYTGIYYDSCTLYHQPSVSLTLNKNKEFTYKFLYNDIPVLGTWQQSHDTITLASRTFLIHPLPLSPINKYTDNDSVDRFLTAGKKLIPINKPGYIRNACFLSKYSK